MAEVPAWLGLEEVDEGRWSFELTSPLGRGDGKLYGGTGLAATIALMEAVTGRDALWTTVQFVGSANLGDRLDCDVAVLANGRRTSQLRITVHQGDRIVLVATGAAGVHAESPVEVQVATMPDAGNPEDAEEFIGRMPGREMSRQGWPELADVRRVDTNEDQLLMWGRLRNDPITRPALGFMADFVPVSVMRAAGEMGAGFSLDNSMRFGYLVPTDWVLFDYDPVLAAGGYLHGGVRAWAQDGTLLGYASQTAQSFTPNFGPLS